MRTASRLADSDKIDCAVEAVCGPPRVITQAGGGAGDASLLVPTIASAQDRGRAGDVPISDIAAARLTVASVVRTEKIATIDDRETAASVHCPSRIARSWRRNCDGPSRYRPIRLNTCRSRFSCISIEKLGIAAKPSPSGMPRSASITMSA